MDEVAMILSLVYRLGLTRDEFLALKQIGNHYYKVTDPEVGTCVVSHMLKQYGCEGCRHIMLVHQEYPLILPSSASPRDFFNIPWRD